MADRVMRSAWYRCLSMGSATALARAVKMPAKHDCRRLYSLKPPDQPSTYSRALDSQRIDEVERSCAGAMFRPVRSKPLRSVAPMLHVLKLVRILAMQL